MSRRLEREEKRRLKRVIERRGRLVACTDRKAKKRGRARRRHPCTAKTVRERDCSYVRKAEARSAGVPHYGCYRRDEGGAVVVVLDAGLAARLRGVYHAGYAFPEWSIAAVAADPGLLRGARVYHDAGADAALVRRVATEREPVNIAGGRHYRQAALERLFGWRTGFYGRHYAATGRLAPNIGVYTPARVRLPDGRVESIHVYNAVGYAFDVPSQPDYRYFFGGRRTKQRRAELARAYRALFERIYVCAEQQGLGTVVMSLVGAATFGALYRAHRGADGPAALRREVWLPALAAVRSRHPGVETVFMGLGGAAHEPGIGGVYTDIGRFPAIVGDVNVKNTLFVNAWDPFSLPGNGNALDPTLDGYMGRCTTIALTGSFMTNKHMKLVSVPDPVI